MMMKFMEFLWSFPTMWRIIISLLLISVNLLLVWGVSWYGMSVYKKTGSPEEALNRMGRLYRYFLSIVLLMTMIPAILLLYVSIDLDGLHSGLGELFLYALFIALILLTLLIKLGQRFIIHRAVKSIRGTSDKFRKSLGTMVRSFLVFFGPLVLGGIVLINLPDSVAAVFWSQKIYPVSSLAAYILLSNFFMPLIVRFVLKTVLLEDSVLLERLQGLFVRVGLKVGKIRIWPAVGSKVANAVVTGFFRGNVLLTDYMIHCLTPEELEAILAHELGHLKKGHLWVRLLLSILWAPIFLIFDNMATGARMDPMSPPYLLTILVLFVLYFYIVVRFIARVQERQADHFALEIGIESITMISALYKIARLNHVKFKQGKVDERLQTHPSMERRIKWLMLAGNLSEDSVGSTRETNM